MLIYLDLVVTEDSWYVVQILDLQRLSIVYRILAQSKKFIIF